MRLDELPKSRTARIQQVDWDALDPAEAQRLREFGICEGGTVELLHRGGLWRTGTVACRIGRMTIAMRVSHAMAITVQAMPSPDEAAPAAPVPEGALVA